VKFFEYFGVVGTLSVLAWIGAAYALARSRHDKPNSWRWLFGALAAAVLATRLGRATSDAIMNARIDDREQIAMTLKEHEEMADDIEKQKLTARFAEDSPEDVLAGKDLTALKEAKGETPEGTAAGTEAGASAGETSLSGVTAAEAPPDVVPAYARGGKRTRAEGKKVGGDGKVGVRIEDTSIRYMKADDLAAARRLDRLNRLAIRLLLLGTLGMMASDYLRAFNRTLTTRWLVPIGGPWLDAISPKARLVLITPPGAAALSPADYAGAAMRRGENVIYFGGRDPWDGAARVARVSVRTWIAWGVTKLVAGAPGVPAGAEFLLDGAWFGRYAVVMPGSDGAEAVLSELIALLRRRRETGAAARRTLHLVWARAEQPAGEILRALRGVAGDTNVRLAVWAGAAETAGLRAAFDEIR